MSKLYRARSLLYRRQILQENIRWKALDEIYKIYIHAFAPLRSQNVKEKRVRRFAIFLIFRAFTSFEQSLPFSINFLGISEF